MGLHGRVNWKQTTPSLRLENRTHPLTLIARQNYMGYASMNVLEYIVCTLSLAEEEVAQPTLSLVIAWKESNPLLASIRQVRNEIHSKWGRCCRSQLERVIAIGGAFRWCSWIPLAKMHMIVPNPNTAYAQVEASAINIFSSCNGKLHW